MYKHWFIHMKEVEKYYSVTLIGPEQPYENMKVLYVNDGIDYVEFSPLLKYQSSIFFVLIHPGSPYERSDTYRSDGQYHRAYMQSFYEELVPKVEDALSSFNITQKGLIGDSYAGNVSVALALENTDYWTHVLLQSAAIMEEEIKRLSQVKHSLNWKVYQSVGRNEENYHSYLTGEPLYILSRNQRFHDLLLQRHAQVELNIMDTDHGWIYWEEDLPRLMEFFN